MDQHQAEGEMALLLSFRMGRPLNVVASVTASKAKNVRANRVCRAAKEQFPATSVTGLGKRTRVGLLLLILHKNHPLVYQKISAFVPEGARSQAYEVQPPPPAPGCRRGLPIQTSRIFKTSIIPQALSCKKTLATSSAFPTQQRP